MIRLLPLLLLVVVLLPALEQDKRLHLVGGALIGASVDLALAASTDLRPWQRWLIATGTATAIGWAKELRDRQGFGNYEARDAWMTAAGGAGGAGLSLTLTWRFCCKT